MTGDGKTGRESNPCKILVFLCNWISRHFLCMCAHWRVPGRILMRCSVQFIPIYFERQRIRTYFSFGLHTEFWIAFAWTRGSCNIMLYMYISLYMEVYEYIYIYIYIYVCILCMRMYITHVHAYTGICTWAHIHKLMHACMRVLWTWLYYLCSILAPHGIMTVGLRHMRPKPDKNNIALRHRCRRSHKQAHRRTATAGCGCRGTIAWHEHVTHIWISTKDICDSHLQGWYATHICSNEIMERSIDSIASWYTVLISPYVRAKE